MGLKFQNPNFNIMQDRILEQAKVAESGTDYMERVGQISGTACLVG